MTPNKSTTPSQQGKTFVGEVISSKMQDTITVLLKYSRRHPLYKKTIKKNKKIYAQNNLTANVGDIVKVREVRPLSKQKRFTTVQIIKKSQEATPYAAA